MSNEEFIKESWKDASFIAAILTGVTSLIFIPVVYFIVNTFNGWLFIWIGLPCVFTASLFQGRYCTLVRNPNYVNKGMELR